MKKLLKGALTLAIATIVGIPQLQAAGNSNYSIQVKNYRFDKEYQNPTTRKGLAYTYGKAEYTNSEWIYQEKSYGYTTPFTANYYDPYNRTTTNNKTCYVKQFGVSKGVVYWIDPTKNVINYWNTIDGTSGSFTPTMTYKGKTYSFKGSDTGYGSITNDWNGNLVHVWNGYQGDGHDINTTPYGFAVYKAPDTYGTRITTAPVLSDMTDTYLEHTLRDGKEYNWTYTTTPHPNYLRDANTYKGSSNMGNLVADGVASKNPLNGTNIAVDFITASGNLYDKVNGMVLNSTYQGGYWGGQVWFAYGHIVTGSMFADGAYANWFINYRVTKDRTIAQIPNGGSYGDGLLYYSREFVFQEVGGSDQEYNGSGTNLESSYNWNEYYYTSPHRAMYQTVQDGLVSHINNTVIYPRGSTGGSDGSVAPDVTMLKGYKVIANNLWKTADLSNGYRNGSIDINVVGGGPSTTDNRIGYAFAYNLSENFSPVQNSSENVWLEFERVNDNVLALYAYSPKQGFSKFFVTAVRKNNAISGVSVTQHNSINNLTPQAKITWTAQPYDRENLHRYNIYYKAYNTATGAVIGESGVTVDNATWKLATVDANGNPKPVDIGTSTTGTFYHNTPIGVDANGKKYQITYKYLIVPVYDGSDHMGQETETGTITPSIPRATVKGNLYQVTDKGGPNGETRYGFSVRLDPYFDANAVGATSAKRFVITSAGGEDGQNALKEATSVTLADGTPLTPIYSASFTEIGGNDPTIVAQYTLDIPVTVGTDGKLPSIIWHNVNPTKTFQVGLHVEYTPYADFVAQNPTPATLTVPNATLSLTEASIHPLVGDYSSLQNNDILPLGAQRRVGSNEVTNPVTLSNANTLGTKGSAINPLLVTDEVLENWSVKYRYNIFKDGGFMVAYDLDASDEAGGATYYSNSNKVMFDIVGLPIEREAWTIHDKMGLDDAQKAANENITKYGYNTSTVNKAYTAHIDVTYTRKDNDKITTVRGGQQDASSPIVFSDAVKDGAIFPNLGVEFGSQFVALKRDNPHWDENCAENDGYFSVYYDAVAQWSWNEYNDDLNRYVGYHAVTSTNCVGHYVNNTNAWIPYYAPSVLSDNYVEQTNISLGKAGNFTDNYNGAVVPLVMVGIGYDGSAKTNWSALAAKERTLPMQVHYVWGGNRELTNEQTDRESTSTKMLMTADYPIIESIYGATIIHNAVAAINDDEDSYYTLIEETNAGVTRMNMISSENHSGVYVDYVTTLTGVEGILVNAAGGVKLYPNPVGSTFTLQAPMAMGEVRIFTTDGQLVKVVKDINDTMVSINVDELPQGMYIVSTLGVAKMMIKK